MKGARRDIVFERRSRSCRFGRADLKDGIVIAAESIDSGAALRKLDELKAFTNRP
jgi:anthranilate phosphoribosyltransferase